MINVQKRRCSTIQEEEEVFSIDIMVITVKRVQVKEEEEEKVIASMEFITLHLQSQIYSTYDFTTEWLFG